MKIKFSRLAIILTVAFLARFAMAAPVIADIWRAFTPDARGYYDLAVTMKTDGQFATDGQAEIFRTPGYPAMIFSFMKIFGDQWNSNEYISWGLPLIALQIILDVWLVWMTYRIGKGLLDEKIALLAAAFQAISPIAVGACCRFLTDSMFAFMLTAAFMLAMRYLRGGRNWNVIASAIALAAGCYLRPVAIALSLAFMLAMLMHGTWRRRLASIIGFALIFAACLSPWSIRNHYEADYNGFSSFASDSVFYFALPEVISRDKKISPQQARDEMKKIDFQNASQNPSRTPGQAARWRQQYNKNFIVEHLPTYTEVHMKGSLGFLLPGTDVIELSGLSAGQRGTIDIIHSKGLWEGVKFYFANNTAAAIVAVPIVILLAIQYFGVFIATMAKVRFRMSAAAWLMLMLPLLAMIATGPFGQPRYRLPIEPILSVAAAAGLCILIRRIRKTKINEGESSDVK